MATPDTLDELLAAEARRIADRNLALLEDTVKGERAEQLINRNEELHPGYPGRAPIEELIPGGFGPQAPFFFPEIPYGPRRHISNPELQKLGIHNSPISPAVLLSLTDRGRSVESGFIADERQWTIENFSRSENDVTATKRTYGRTGYYTRGLGPSSSMIDMTMQYSPLGTVGNAYSWDVEDWYIPLNRLRHFRGSNIDLRIGGLKYGIWVFKSPKYDYLNLLRLPGTDNPVVVPRVIRCTFRFESVDEKIEPDINFFEVDTEGRSFL